MERVNSSGVDFKTQGGGNGGQDGQGSAWIAALEKVHFVRSRRPILTDITWRLRAGEHWVVLGANGSGKTTLLLLLAGYLWPTQGSITVLGQRFGTVDLREVRKKIGWVGSFLQEHVPAHQKPLDLIVGGKFASIGVDEKPSKHDMRMAERLAETMGCAAVLNNPYGVLSQGEKQRVLIARALMAEPRLLILDEPCSGLDVVAREQLLETLERMGRKDNGPALVLVTHHLEDIVPVFSHVLVLRQGRCVASGLKEHVLTAPVLSTAFDIPIEVEAHRGRYWTRIGLL
ncbi:ABC transporter ATP-binding protein [Desulfosoma caldarium]|uniref:Iron complex transport system ATP-binding protein n=1 Tax=Desulfosoma caldarium TaxID=610254 RepID=A0A3N1UW48_9BACT|nr:ATP-binding cassette domain-containing protein [Desulfosoma caldarium]ROQ92141.1 iron complex transport system ATP-binding protein [Desulfosoma caldarium]